MRMYKPYTSKDGQHFADADVGDNVYYSVDVTNVLLHPSAVVDNVSWVLPTGLESEDTYIEDNIAYCKIKCKQSGTFSIKIGVTSRYNTKSATDVSVVFLTVY